MNLNSISQCPTPLNQTFFSEFNQEVIHRGIRQNIFNKYGVRVDKQSPDAILTFMRTVFINNSADPYGDVCAQVKYMNEIVVNMASEQVASGVAQYYGYLRDVERPLQPPPVPTNTSLYGVKIGYNNQIGL